MNDSDDDSSVGSASGAVAPAPTLGSSRLTGSRSPLVINTSLGLPRVEDAEDEAGAGDDIHGCVGIAEERGDEDEGDGDTAAKRLWAGQSSILVAVSYSAVLPGR